MRKQNKNKEMTITAHLRELRLRFVVCILFFIAAFVVCYTHVDYLINLLQGISSSADYTLVYLSPQEVLIGQLSISGFSAFIITLPIICYEVASFISPALSVKHPMLIFLVFGIVGVMEFIIGVAFAYKILLPFTFKFLFDIAEASNIKASISFSNYVSFCMTIMSLLGILFEMPLLSWLLSRIGLINRKLLRNIKPYVIVACFIIGAIITPPDVISQVMVAIPMIVLYQFSIFVCRKE